MGRTYNSESARRLASSDILDMINEYHEDKNNLKTRAMSALACLQEEDYPDAKLRKICLESSSQIYSAYSEGKELIGLSLSPDNPAERWIESRRIYLPNYTRGVSEIRGLDNSLYKSYIEDLDGIWDLFKSYSSNRNEKLNDWKDVFDDSYCRVRHVIEHEVKYTRVLSDVSTSKSAGFITSVSKDKKTIVEDVIFKQWDSSPIPKVPTIPEFRGLVENTWSNDSVYGLCDSIINLVNCIGTEAPSWGNNFVLEFDKANPLRYSYVTAKGLSKSLAEQIMREMPKMVLFCDSSRSNYVACTVNNKVMKIDEVGGIKSPYLPNYNGSSEEVKKYVYNHYPEVYNDNLYKISLDLVVEAKIVVGSGIVGTISNYDGGAIGELCKKKARELSNKLAAAKNYYDEALPETRCETGDPSIYYDDYAAKLSGYIGLTFNRDICLRYKDYATKIKKWAKTRGRDLYAQTTDDVNAGRLIEALKKRLDKDTGTIMMWYQNLLSIDQEFRNSDRSDELINYSLGSLLVSKAVDCEDEESFKYQNCPNYIDVEEPDSLYDDFNYSFNIGDTIYIVDDLHSEVKATIMGVDRKALKTSDYSNVNLEKLNNGAMQGLITKTKYCYRLSLNKNLATYYSNENDVSSLRVLKIM